MKAIFIKFTVVLMLVCLVFSASACSDMFMTETGNTPNTSASATVGTTQTADATQEVTTTPTQTVTQTVTQVATPTPAPSTETTATVKPTATVSVTNRPTDKPTATPVVTAPPTKAPTATPAPTPTLKPGPTWGGKTMIFNGNKTNITVTADTVNATTEFPTFSFSGQSALKLNTAASEQFNYYSITYKSSQPLWMYIQYTRNGSAYEELSFLDATEEFKTFNSYIDDFMDLNPTAVNITGFRFENRKANKTATLEISSISTAKKSAVSRNVYLQNNYVKLGADLIYGGAISYLEYIKEPVAMITKNGRAEIGINYASQGNVRNTSVNLLNNYDTGRLVQQSYYGTYGGGNDGYEPGQFSGMTWCYNPVMGGDKGNTNSKIVDFVATSTSIYVKCRPMDWGKVNSPTYSYMESTYTLDGRNVIVNNRFTDYSPYTHVRANQELPALYVSEPLYRLVYCTDTTPWDHGNLDMVSGLPDWNGVWPTFKSTENWWAWVNGDDANPFGIGLYVPNVTEVTGGIHKFGGNVGNDASKAAPTSYIAPLRQMTIRVFKPIEYSYALICGTLPEIRASVYDLNDRKVIDNTSLTKYR